MSLDGAPAQTRRCRGRRLQCPGGRAASRALAQDCGVGRSPPATTGGPGAPERGLQWTVVGRTGGSPRTLTVEGPVSPAGAQDTSLNCKQNAVAVCAPIYPNTSDTKFPQDHMQHPPVFSSVFCLTSTQTYTWRPLQGRAHVSVQVLQGGLCFNMRSSSGTCLGALRGMGSQTARARTRRQSVCWVRGQIR